MSKKIYLSPSNQNSNAYATGNTNEMTQCDKIANATASALKRCGFDVKVGKSGDSMQNRCSESNSFGADIHMPIHTNAYNGSVTGGTRVFVLNSKNATIGNAVLKTLGAISPGTGDKLTYQTGLYEINVPNAVTVYVECEFHDTKVGSEWIRNNTAKIAEAITKGLCNYFNYSYKAPSDSNSSSSVSTPSSLSSASIKYSSEVKKWQKSMNIGFDFKGANLDEDGLFGSASSAFAKSNVLYKGISNCPTAVKWLQGKIGATQDGIFGNDTYNKLVVYQRKNGLVADGECGLKTYRKLLGI